MRRLLIGLLGLASAVALTTNTAHADSKPKTHDGFHFQAALGLGYYSTSADSAGIDQSISGMTFPGQLLLGGTIMEGLAFGGGLVLDYAPSPTLEQGGVEVELNDFSQMIIGLGAYADYYVPAQLGPGNLHLQFFAGWGGLESISEGNAGGSDPTGLYTHLGAGYDFWVGDQWSAGGLFRFTYAPFSQNDVGFTTISPSLIGTITWH